MSDEAIRARPLIDVRRVRRVVTNVRCTGAFDEANYLDAAVDEMVALRNEKSRLESELAAMTRRAEAAETQLECAELRIKKLDRLMEFEEVAPV